jgi:exonuclease VII large subunit
MVTPSRTDMALRIRDALDDLTLLMAQRLSQQRAELGAQQQILTQVGPTRLIRDSQARVANARLQLERSCSDHLDQRRQEIRQHLAVLQALNPRHVLDRGFAHLLNRESGAVVTSEHAVTVGDQLLASVADGTIRLVVEGTANKPRHRSSHNATSKQREIHRPLLFELPYSEFQAVCNQVVAAKGAS